MSGDIVEPNLGSLASTVPEGTYFTPHATVPALLDGETDAASTFDDPRTDIGDSAEVESGRLELPDPGGFAGFEAFTLELWFSMPESFDAGTIVERATATGGFRIELQPRVVSDGLDQVFFFYFDDSDTSIPYDGRRRQLIRNDDLGGEGEVHHLAVVYRQTASTSFDLAGNADDIEIWIDGVPTNPFPCCGKIPLPEVVAPLQIGLGYSGGIDEFVVYDRELSAAEIQFHHAVGRDDSLSCE